MRWFPILVAVGAIALAACGDNNQITTDKDVTGSPQVQEGNYLLRSHGCLGCHTTDGTVGTTGPTFKGLSGSQVQLADGSTVTANDSYLRASIQYPSAQTVKGFPAGYMEASIKHRKKLTPQQIDDIVAYIDTLK